MFCISIRASVVANVGGPVNLFADWRVFALGSAFFAGVTAVLAKLGVAGLNSNLATVIRTTVILLFAAMLVTWRGEWQRPQDLEWKGLAFLILSGLATGLSWLCYFRALQLGPVSKVAPIDKLSVIFAMTLAFVFLAEPIGARAAVGGLLILAGAIVLAIG